MDLELLPNEIFLDLFDYLNGVDLLHAFYGLNSRFDFLLYKQFRSFRFKYDFISKRKFDTIYQQHLPFIADRIIALSLFDTNGIPSETALFFSYVPSLKQFTLLRSLSLSNIYSYEILMRIVDECHYLCHLTYLAFDSCIYSSSNMFSKLIIDNIWSLRKLNSHSHSNGDTMGIIRDYFCIPTKISSSIERLSVFSCHVKLDQIYQLFEYTPRLKHLSLITEPCFVKTDVYVPCSLPTLIDLNIQFSFVLDISQILSLLQNMPNLRHLNIDLLSNVIDGYKWKEIISNYLPKLKTFQLSMNYKLLSNENKQEQISTLFHSFRSSFWIDEHRWFIRCLTCGPTIYLYTPPKTLTYCKDMFPDLFMSMKPGDDLQRLCDDITETVDERFFSYPIPSSIRLTNIKELHLRLPINDQFWSVVPSLNRLHSLRVPTNIDGFQSKLQALLDRAPNLYSLAINEDRTLPFQMSFFQYINASVRELELEQWFNEEECITLVRSPLFIKCEKLFIRLRSADSIVYLVKNMINLRFLDVICEEKKCKSLLQTEESPDENLNKLIQWLREQLPLTWLIVRNYRCFGEIQIWI